MQVLHQLPHTHDENLLVGIETADDAAVYRLADGLAVVSTLDFFPPIVDDPFTFGQIAAANSLSDIYAMGGTPKIATNIVCFPKALELDILADIIKGSMDKLKEAGALLAGGHSVEDAEIKYGLSVTGVVDPNKVITNRGARAGDRLVLTKPIGTGVYASAMKPGRVSQEDCLEVIESMTTLNKSASEAMVEAGVNACTDVTGYGLLGHASEMAAASGVSLVIRSGDVRVFPKALELINKRKNRPRAIETNRAFLSESVEISEKVDNLRELLLYDPQTSGGLLMAVAGDREKGLIERLRQRSIPSSVIGEVVEKQSWAIRVE
jgi:selenide,water dikinase